MIAVRTSLILAAFVPCAACVGSGPPVGERTVFSNPLAPAAPDRRGIGPQCDVEFGRDSTCLGAPLAYPGEGRRVLLANGDTIRLTRAQARILRERAALIEARRERQQDQPLSPPPRQQGDAGAPEGNP